MNKSKFIVLFCFFFFLLQCEEKYTYNFDFPLPYINARLNEVFPANIFNYQRKAVRLDMPEGVIGYGASYGDGILMKVIQFKQGDAAILYFKEIVIPHFKDLPSRNRTGEIDGI